jgi:hypothetical protein
MRRHWAAGEMRLIEFSSGWSISQNSASILLSMPRNIPWRGAVRNLV